MRAHLKTEVDARRGRRSVRRRIGAARAQSDAAMMAARTRVLGPAPDRACPFLKWAGGKGQLLGELVPRLPGDVAHRRHVEPFLGGGALFFECSPHRALLSDVNTDLVATYVAVRDRLDDVLVGLESLASAHGEDAYYRARERYNGREHRSDEERAALFVYLNKTCFNGLYRVNARGEFNAPMGRYKNPAIMDSVKLRAASARLRGVDLRATSFEALVDSVRPSDFVYLDPPYPPVSRTANFTSYTACRFTRADHVRLCEVFHEVDRLGAKVMLSSSDVPFIRELYRGYAIEQVLAARPVSCCSGSRGPVRELVIRNYDEGPGNARRGRSGSAAKQIVERSEREKGALPANGRQRQWITKAHL